MKARIEGYEYLAGEGVPFTLLAPEPLIRERPDLGEVGPLNLDPDRWGERSPGPVGQLGGSCRDMLLLIMHVKV